MSFGSRPSLFDGLSRAPRSTVNVHNERERRWWAAELGVSTERLDAAVLKVGVQLSAVRRELERGVGVPSGASAKPNGTSLSAIDIADPRSLGHWSSRFQVSPELLCKAVRAVGHDPAAVLSLLTGTQRPAKSPNQESTARENLHA